MKIYLAADHAGFDLKEHLRPWLANKLGDASAIRDFGTHTDASVDYPDMVHPAVTALLTALSAGEEALGILICGSGNGVCITANKHLGIYAAIAWAPELAKLARTHNNANVLCLPARFMTQQAAEEAVAAFIENTFEGGRHQVRVDKVETF